MKTLSPLRPIPSNARYWCVTLGKREHHFRFPSWAVAQVVTAETIQGYSGHDLASGLQTAWRRYSPWMGMVLGACWYHRGKQPEAPTPGWRADVAEWLDFGAAFVDELQEDGYTLAETITLYNACMGAINDRMGVLMEATKQADFTGGGEGSPPPASPPRDPDPTRGSGPAATTISPPKSA